MRYVSNYSLCGVWCFSCVPHVGEVNSVSITFIQATHTTHTRNASKMASVVGGFTYVVGFSLLLNRDTSLLLSVPAPLDWS